MLLRGLNYNLNLFLYMLLSLHVMSACSGRKPLLLEDQKVSIVLNQNYKPSRYLATASLNGKGPVYIEVKCKPKKSEDHHTASSLKNAHWYPTHQLEKEHGFKIKSKVAHQLGLTIYSDLQGHRWITVQQTQIDRLLLKKVSWQVVNYDELPIGIDAQMSCQTLAHLLGNDDDIYLRSHLTKGVLEFKRSAVELTHDQDQSDQVHDDVPVDLDRFTTLWSFSKSYSQPYIATIIKYHLPSILGTHQGRQALQLLPIAQTIKVPTQKSLIHFQWRTPKQELPEDLWFIINLSPKTDKAFYLRVHIKKSSRSFVMSKWPTNKNMSFLKPDSKVTVVDIVRGPWRCKHTVCMSEFTLDEAYTP